MPTTKLNLPLIDGTNTADVVRDFNALANAVDNKAGASDGLATLGADGKVPASQLNVSAPADATTSTKGVVQLSNSTTSTSEALAATPKAVKDAKDGLSAQIGILSGLNTTNKTNLVSAINEVFQTGNNVKSDMVAALLAVDPTLPITSNSTWAEIETATGQISTGKKWAKGTTASLTGTLPFTTRTGTSFEKPRLRVTGLDFTPSTVVVNNSAGIPAMKITKNNGMSSGFHIGFVDNGYPNYEQFRLTGNAYMVDGEFQLPVHSASTNYNWTAYE